MMPESPYQQGISMKPGLGDFALCPYMQRSIMILLEKSAEFDVTYIDQENKAGGS